VLSDCLEIWSRLTVVVGAVDLAITLVALVVEPQTSAGLPMRWLTAWWWRGEAGAATLKLHPEAETEVILREPQVSQYRVVLEEAGAMLQPGEERG
jgi:hypothetical protein